MLLISLLSPLHVAPASRNEYQSIRLQLESEDVPPLMPGLPVRTFHQLPPADQAAMEKKRLAGQLLLQFFSRLFCYYSTAQMQRI